MKPFALCAFLFSLHCFAARVETFSIDLERPLQPFTLSFTENVDTTVAGLLKASGAEFDPSDWTCLLWYGTTTGGITLTNSTASYGAATWNIPSAHVPTNGRYFVQIFGAKTNIVEEWGRGVLIVRLNPAHDYLPAEWATDKSIYSLLNVTSNVLADSIQQLLSYTTGSVGRIESEYVSTEDLMSGHTMGPGVLGSDGAIFEPNLDGGIITQQGTYTNFTVEALLYEMVGTPSVPWQSFENPKTFPFFIGDMTKYWIGNWRGTGTNRYPYIIYSDNGSSEDATWYGVPGGTYPQTLTLVSGSGGGTATVKMAVTNRMLRASVLTGLTGYARMTGTEIGDGFVVLSPNLNESLTISHYGVGYYSLANGLIDIGWPLSTGTIATMQDVTNATAGVATYSQLTNAISDLNTSWVTNEIHKDSFTNLLWKSVFSNGWHWLVAYTNTP